MNISGWFAVGFSVFVDGTTYYLNGELVTRQELVRAICDHFGVNFCFATENPDAATVVSALYQVAKESLLSDPI